jgi:hypothetical protein
MLDKEIKIEEVTEAISSLNRNKSGGYNLLPENYLLNVMIYFLMFYVNFLIIFSLVDH